MEPGSGCPDVEEAAGRALLPAGPARVALEQLDEFVEGAPPNAESDD